MNIQFDNRQYLDLLVYLTEEMGLEMTEALEICQLRQSVWIKERTPTHIGAKTNKQFQP